MTGSATTPMAATPTFAPSRRVLERAVGHHRRCDTRCDGLLHPRRHDADLASSVFSNPVSVSGNETLNAIAAASGYTTSAVGSAPYQIAASAPTFSPGAGTYSSPQSSPSTTQSARDDPLHLRWHDAHRRLAGVFRSDPCKRDGTLKAIAVASGYTVSAVGSAAYKIEAAVPTFSPGAARTRARSRSPSPMRPRSHDLLHDQWHGAEPASSAYSAPVGVSAKETLKAIAAAGGYSTSDVASAAYKFEAAPPTFSPGAGTYPGAQSVTITDATPEPRSTTRPMARRRAPRRPSTPLRSA